MNENYEVIINSKTDKELLNLKELFQYKDLIKLLVKRNFSLMYKQTILGPAWLILNPLLMSIMFSVVFGQFVGIQTDGVPHFIFYVTSTTMWTLFSTSVTNTANTFIANTAIFGKVYFPRLTVPISQAITSFLNFCLQFIVVIIFIGFYLINGGSVAFSPWSFLLIPILSIQLAVLGLGVGIIITSITVKYRDLAVAIGFFIQLWMYGSPVIYPMTTTGGWMRTILLINPVTPIINNFRCVFLGTGEMLYGSWALSAAVTVILFIIGCKLFNKTQKTFIDQV